MHKRKMLLMASSLGGNAEDTEDGTRGFILLSLSSPSRRKKNNHGENGKFYSLLSTIVVCVCVIVCVVDI